MAREGKYIPYGKYGDSVAVLPAYKFNGAKRRRALINADQLICGTNKTRSLINDEVRKIRGFQGFPADGEKLICTQNNWETFIDNELRFNLVNGIIGTVTGPFYDIDKRIGFIQFKADFLDKSCPEALPLDIGIFTDGYYRYKRGDYFEKFDESGEPAGAFTLNRFDFGYCISCHKAQGSEFDNVIVFDESYCFKEDRNRWLYTAITRAKKNLIIIK